MAKGKGRASHQDAHQQAPAPAPAPAPEAVPPQEPPPQDAAQDLATPTHTIADVELVMHNPPPRYTVGEIARGLLDLAQSTEDGLSTFLLCSAAVC